MDWSQLLSEKRLGATGSDGPSIGRSEFQRDFDRITFSSSFRRLQDKTQVVPLAVSDYVRTRLTHSLEVSSVGRSLGTAVGLTIFGDYEKAVNLGTIVAAACIAHDIGNPPFGHSGEDAIRHWFANTQEGKESIQSFDERQKQDFLRFEGNAQGFRILARLQDPTRTGGLQLTFSTLAAFTKYPKESFVEGQEKIYTGQGAKKFGFFQADKELFAQVANGLGLTRRHTESYWWARHPLSFLVEAADDICFLIIDFEDGYRLKRLDFDEIRKPFEEIINDGQTLDRAKGIQEEDQRIAYLRSKAINALIDQVSQCFVEHASQILDASFDKELISQIPTSMTLDLVRKVSIETVYSARDIVEIEAAGFEVLSGLLGSFVSAVNDIAQNGKKATEKNKKLVQLIPSQFLKQPHLPDKDDYIRLLQVVDFVSGMTDSYAVMLFKKIRGISLPTG